MCTCVSVGTIYCDDVNSESICRITSTCTVYQSAEHHYLSIALFIDLLYCWSIVSRRLHQMPCSGPEVLNATANWETQQCKRWQQMTKRDEKFVYTVGPQGTMDLHNSRAKQASVWIYGALKCHGSI